MNTAQPIGSVCLYLGDLAQVSQAPNPAWSSGDSAVAASAASRTDGPLRALLEPLGWMPCDGREMRISRYPDLFAALGCLYGGQYERGIFNLPDLRGMFVRGLTTAPAWIRTATSVVPRTATRTIPVSARCSGMPCRRISMTTANPPAVRSPAMQRRPAICQPSPRRPPILSPVA